MLRRVGHVSEALLGLTLLTKTSSLQLPIIALAVRTHTDVSMFTLVVYINTILTEHQ